MDIPIWGWAVAVPVYVAIGFFFGILWTFREIEWRKGCGGKACDGNCYSDHPDHICGKRRYQSNLEYCNWCGFWSALFTGARASAFVTWPISMVVHFNCMIALSAYKVTRKPVVWFGVRTFEVVSKPFISFWNFQQRHINKRG